MKRLTRLIAVAALVAAGSTGTAVATASPPAPPPGLPLYLALGDSVANGQNSAEPTDIGDYWDTVALWHQDGYVTPFKAYLKGALNCLPAASAQAADGCRQLQLTNLARSAVPANGAQPALPGVTTALLIDEQLGTAEKQLVARNRDDNPRNDVEVVTLTVGGNEIFDAFKTLDPAAVQAAMTTFAQNYGQIVYRLRQAAGPKTPILTMTYFNPLPYCDLPGGPLPPTVLAMGDGVLRTMNTIIRGVSAANGAVPAEVYGLLGTGDFFDCKHPNEAGYAKIATAFETAWQAATS